MDSGRAVCPETVLRELPLLYRCAAIPWQTFGSIRAYMIQAALASAGKGEGEEGWDCVYRFLAVVDAGVEVADADADADEALESVMRPEHTRALDNASASKSMPGTGCSLSQWGQLCNMVLLSTGVFEVFSRFLLQGNRSHGSIQAFIVFLLEPQA